MESNKPIYKVYILLDEQNYITAINSDSFIDSLDGWIYIDEGTTVKYHHAQGNYLPKPIRDTRGIAQYKFENNQVIERTQEEMDADFIEIAPRPSQLDIIEAQVTYTAMMTDTLLEV